jgi:CspA family cold shock protein
MVTGTLESLSACDTSRYDLIYVFRSFCMAEGIIKKLESVKQFGFIGPADGSNDLFFHCSGIKNATFEELEEGQSVEFDLGDGPKGPRAENIRVV